MINILAFFMKN